MGVHIVVILDEVDQLQDKELLYDLHRIQSLTLILIANREEAVFSPLDERLHSRLWNTNRIPVTTYSDEELVSILEDRARWGLAEDVLSETELREIAEYSSGDARVAIGILRKLRERLNRTVLTESRRELLLTWFRKRNWKSNSRPSANSHRTSEMCNERYILQEDSSTIDHLESTITSTHGIE